MTLQRRKQASEGGEAPRRVLVDPKFAKDYPTLLKYLTQREWEDGSPRQTSTFTVFVEDASWKIVLRDRDAAECLWAAAGSFGSLLLALEGALTSETADWRVERNHGQQQAKRVKRA